MPLHLSYCVLSGTFILVFLLIWILICLPLYLLESALGQFSGRGFTSSWKCVQLFKGTEFDFF